MILERSVGRLICLLCVATPAGFCSGHPEIATGRPPAFEYAKPDFIYCDDGTGKRRLVFISDKSGRNVGVRIRYDSPRAKLLAWQVLTETGELVAGAHRDPAQPPADGTIAIPDGTLDLGAYALRVQIWDTDDAAQTPATFDVPLRIAPRAVALVVGIDWYGSALPELRHAADDAWSWRAKLIERGYAPENIVHVLGRNRDGTPELSTNGLQNPRSETPNDLSLVRRTGQRFGLAGESVVRRAFSDALMKLVSARRAEHVLIFFAGHGDNVRRAASGVDLAMDRLLLADIGANPTAAVMVYDWPAQIRNSIRWGSRESPVTIMCLVDASRNGDDGTLDGLPPDLRSDDGGVFCSAVFSCRKGERANENIDADPRLSVTYANEVFGNGFFTYALLRGLDSLPGEQAKLPDLLDRAAPILSSLVSQASARNRVAGEPKPYSERQSLRSKDDLRRWEESLEVVYPVPRPASAR